MSFALHPLTYKMVQLLKEGNLGDVKTEKELGAYLGVSCTPNTEGKKRISKAITITYRDHHVLWKWYKNKDTDERILKVCGKDDVLKEVDSERRRITKTAVRLSRKSLCLDEKQLNNEEQLTYRALQVQALMAKRVTANQSLKKMTENGSQLIAPELPALLELMKK